jgi:hypothetical protein
MGILEQIQQLKERGIPENQIIANLKEQNYSPKQISDALSQSQIKNAVTNQEFYAPSPDENMQQSIMKNSEFNPPMPEKSQGTYKNYEQSGIRPDSEFPNYEEYSPSQETFSQYPQQEENNFNQYPQSPEQENNSQYSSQEFNMPEEHYSPFSENPQNQNTSFASNSTDMMIDISEQVFEEKISELKKQLREVSELKSLTEVKIKNIDKRLEKIENIIDKLQITILEKIGNYGSNINAIKNEMSMMQDSFGKMINPLKEIAEKTHHNIIHHKANSSSKTHHKKIHSKKK